MSITPPPLFRQLWIVDGLDGEICIPAEIVELIYEALWVKNPPLDEPFHGHCERSSYNERGMHHLHEKLGPARVWNWSSGFKQLDYVWEGRCHRDADKPAVTEFYSNGRVSAVKYYKRGRLHRQNAPAVTFYLRNGEVESETYYIEGRRVNPQNIFPFDLPVPTNSLGFFE